jgi:hypothetical protein
MDLKATSTAPSRHACSSYLPDDTIVVLWAPLEIASRRKSYLDRLPDVKGIYPLQACSRKRSVSRGWN